MPNAARKGAVTETTLMRAWVVWAKFTMEFNPANKAYQYDDSQLRRMWTESPWRRRGMRRVANVILENLALRSRPARRKK